MKKLNLLFIVIVIAILTLVGCSKKNAFGKTNDSKNTGNNGVGNLIISPTPATYGNTIKIAGVTKHIKFSPNDIEIFFSSTISSMRYDVDVNSITIIPGQPDTLQFILPNDIPMDAYLVKVVYNKTNDTLSYNGYAVLDAEVIKNAVIVTSITPSSVDISQGTFPQTITIIGNNFSTTLTENTIILNQNGKEFIATITSVNATGTSISFTLPNTILNDIKTPQNYDLYIKVIGKSNVPKTNIQIQNNGYPTITSFDINQDSTTGKGAGTHIKITGSNFNTTASQITLNLVDEDNSSHITTITATDAQHMDFYIDRTLFSGNYTLYMYQKSNIGISRTDTLVYIYNGQLSNAITIKPYITKIDTTTAMSLPVDYSTTDIIGIDVYGANLLETRSKVGFTIQNGDVTSPIASSNKVSYPNFSKGIQAGEISITSSEAAFYAPKTIEFYKPTLTSISFNQINQGSAFGNLSIDGTGLLGNVELGFIGASETQWIPATGIGSTAEVSKEILNTIPSGSYDIAVRTNNGQPSMILPNKKFIVKSNDIPKVTEIETLVIGSTTLKLAIHGTGFRNTAKVKFYTMSGTTVAPILTLLETISSESGTDENKILITLQTSNIFTTTYKDFGLYFNIVDQDELGNEVSLTQPQSFLCIKAVELYTKTNVNYTILYSSLLTSDAKLGVFGDSFGFPSSIGITGLFGKTPTDIRTHNSGGRMKSNTFLLSPPIGVNIGPGRYKLEVVGTSFMSSGDIANILMSTDINVVP